MGLACEHLGDRFLFAVLYGSGCRIGEALGVPIEVVSRLVGTPT